MIELAAKQTWTPTTGERSRQIVEIRAAGAGDYPYWMGVILIVLASDVKRSGRCTQSSFRAWIRRTKAKLI